MTVSVVFALAFAVTCAVILQRSVRLVPEHHVLLVERLGVQRRTLPAGLHLLVPIVDAPIGTFAERALRAAHVDVAGRTSDQRPVRCMATVRYAETDAPRTPLDPTELASRIVEDAFARAASTDVRSNTDEQLEQYLRSELDDAFQEHAMRVIDVRLTSIVRP